MVQKMEYRAGQNGFHGFLDSHSPNENSLALRSSKGISEV